MNTQIGMRKHAFVEHQQAPAAKVQPERWENKGIVVRPGPEVHAALVAEPARRAIRTGRRVSLEGLVVEILEGWRGRTD